MSFEKGKKMLKRYIAFVYDPYEGGGGWENVVKDPVTNDSLSFDTVEEAVEAALSQMMVLDGTTVAVNAQIVDITIGKVIDVLTLNDQRYTKAKEHNE